MMGPINHQEEAKQKTAMVLRSNFEAYQQKVQYEIENDIEESVSSDNEDVL